jgi:beta-phosphoglucomutase
VLFDLDGVLVDSMPNHVRAWAEIFRRQGLRIDPCWPMLREGEKALSTCHWICEQLDLDWDEATCAARVEEKRIFFRSLPGSGPFPAVPGLLRTLHAAGKPMALVTGSALANARAVLPEPLWELFSAHITAEDVRRAKPDPEPYLSAAARLGLSAGDCLAVENAPLGIRSALAAGCRVLALATTLPAKHLAGAHEIAERHERVLELALSAKEA